MIFNGGSIVPFQRETNNLSEGMINKKKERLIENVRCGNCGRCRL
jgi:hypothetical protein